MEFEARNRAVNSPRNSIYEFTVCLARLVYLSRVVGDDYFFLSLSLSSSNRKPSYSFEFLSFIGSLHRNSARCTPSRNSHVNSGNIGSEKKEKKENRIKEMKFVGHVWGSITVSSSARFFFFFF